MKSPTQSALVLLTLLLTADVCAAPSRNEGMGRALVEAMALGLPVVGTIVGGIPSVIGPDEAGRLVRSEDAAALVKLHVFAGQTLEDAAAVVGVSARTGYRLWTFARAWMFHRLGGGAPAPDSG